MFSVYALKSESTGKIYIGQTANLNKRLVEHNDPEYKLTKHTKRNKGPWKLIYSEEHSTRKYVLKREKQLKSAKGREFIHNLIKSNIE